MEELATLVSGRNGCVGSTGEGDLPRTNRKLGEKPRGRNQRGLCIQGTEGRWEPAEGSQETCQQRAVPYVSTLEATGGPEMRIPT